jgi:transaldolase
MATNRLKALNALGQSVWYDYIRRDLVEGGELTRLIDEDGLSGMTSNPTIFEKAIAGGALYDADIRGAGSGQTPTRVFEALAIHDVRAAADVFRRVFDATGGNDGFVSIEVGPGLARDTKGTIDEARRLWKECDRPNVMVKIPGTAEGVPAIRQCLSEGININITLLFSVPRYREVMEAHLSALEERVRGGQDIGALRSVASFFVSRVDTNVDQKLDALSKGGDTRAAALRGRIAIANAKIAYEAFEEITASPRWKALEAKGARKQRPLWASTSTKDPSLPDLYYVEALVAPDSVDTMPPETFEAFRDHGDAKVRIRDDRETVGAQFRALRDLGISIDQVGKELEDEGVKKFSDSFDSLMKTIGEKQRAMRVA